MDTAGTIILDLRAEVERVGAEALAPRAAGRTTSSPGPATGAHLWTP